LFARKLCKGHGLCERANTHTRCERVEKMGTHAIALCAGSACVRTRHGVCAFGAALRPHLCSVSILVRMQVQPALANAVPVVLKPVCCVTAPLSL
jgi:hypothetical protein